MAGDRTRSLRTRVTAGATAVLAVALVVASVTMAGLVRRALYADIDALLVDRVEVVETLILGDLLTPVLQPTGQEVGQVQVIDVASREVVAGTPGLAGSSRLDVIDPPPVGEEILTTVDGGEIDSEPDEQYRLAAQTLTVNGRVLAIYAVTSLDGAERAERFLRNSLLVGTPFLLLLAAGLIHRVVGRALAPVDDMRAQVDRIEATDLSGRVEATTTDDEIARLGTTLNRMLERLQDAGARQQLFAAAASHELRSPLSAIRTELEVGLEYPDRAEWPHIASDVMIEVNRLEELARDLRVLTRSTTTSGRAGSLFDLAELVAGEVERRRPAEHLRYVTTLAPAPAPVEADPEAITRVVRNLFDNAERHARGEITVTVGTDTGSTILRVGNDGEPVPVGLHERIFEPFLRLDEARTLDAGGSGLGLAIARSIMLASHGTISCELQVHGATFVVRLPAAPR